MKNNKGFSYYELLIVIAIMSLMVGFSTIAISSVFRNNVYKTADSLETAIKAARNNAISKGGDYGYVNFYYKDGVIYTYIGERVDKTLNFSADTRNWQKTSYSIDYLGIGFDTDLGHIGLNPLSGTLFNLRFKQSTGELISWEATYADDVNYIDDFEISVEKNNRRAEITVNKYGNIEIK